MIFRGCFVTCSIVVLLFKTRVSESPFPFVSLSFFRSLWNVIHMQAGGREKTGENRGDWRVWPLEGCVRPRTWLHIFGSHAGNGHIHLCNICLINSLYNWLNVYIFKHIFELNIPFTHIPHSPISKDPVPLQDTPSGEAERTAISRSKGRHKSSMAPGFK